MGGREAALRVCGRVRAALTAVQRRQPGGGGGRRWSVCK